ncbi:MAG: hypothetical protein AVDCRST_MAG59-800 [uncultured Thermomicrobiales bacterium]|uniref:Uncharacterized protein n=1 Tax=uncultured Thermomicrobiales bacterium TaxID=1645740 RepID=A0A6J4U542_9BACT|nr:MAG: hypothetical protein AVDCRST_MAG59-800 [uncultured Thermomicrobiales bacterium]
MTASARHSMVNVAVDPDRSPIPGQTALAVEPPLPDAKRTGSINDAGRPKSEEPVEIGRLAPGSVHPTEESEGPRPGRAPG